MRQSLESVLTELRRIAWATNDGDRIDGEEQLVETLGTSRPTMRQAARLLEHEGLMTVRRGVNGGYFASRPSIANVEAIASTYLQSIHVNRRHMGMIAAALWVEVIREAAELRTPEARRLAAEWIERISACAAETTYSKVVELEQELRSKVFALIEARYVELIFNINSTLGRRGEAIAGGELGPVRLAMFVREWRDAKLMELHAIADGDGHLGALAARHGGNVWAGVFRP
jgi:GntR family transcriptional repressor for pyruvate dehydrogenase complex